MKKSIVLKVKTSQKSYGLETVVKQGKKIEAKISHPTNNPRYQYSDEFKISKSGIAFYRPTLESALEFVRNGLEEYYTAFGSDVSVSIENKGEI